MSERRYNKLKLYAQEKDKTMTQVVDELTDILHHSQQDLKNRVSERQIKVCKCRHCQETRFLTLVQDLS